MGLKPASKWRQSAFKWGSNGVELVLKWGLAVIRGPVPHPRRLFKIFRCFQHSEPCCVAARDTPCRTERQCWTQARGGLGADFAEAGVLYRAAVDRESGRAGRPRGRRRHSNVARIADSLALAGLFLALRTHRPPGEEREWGIQSREKSGCCCWGGERRGGWRRLAVAHLGAVSLEIDPILGA